MKSLRAIAAIVLPPYHVYQLEGVGPTLAVNVVLTLVGWIPGGIHSLWVWSRHGFTTELQRAP